MKDSRKTEVLRLLGWLGALLAAWGLFALWVAPHIVREAYAGRSLPVLNEMIAGRDVHDVSFYLDAWRVAAARITIALLALCVVAYLLWRFRARLSTLARRAARGLPSLRLRMSLLLALALGFVAGVGEFAADYLRLRNTPSAFTWDDLFYTPLVVMAGFSLLVVVLWGVGRTLRSDLPLRLAPIAMATLGAWALLDATSLALHPAAVLLLAVGVGVQVSRFVAARSASRQGWVRRTASVAVLGLVFMAIAIPAAESWGERRALARLPSPAPDAPNVLLIILDTVRAASLSLYGYERETTPHLERFARTGVVFERAVATAPWTLPSHASFFTGRYHHEVSADWNRPLDDRHRTLAEALANLGYRTGAFVANRSFASRNSGLARGFSRYEDEQTAVWVRMASWSVAADVADWVRRRLNDHTPWWRTRADEINRRFLRWLDEVEESGEPFFAFLNYMDAHEPYQAPPPFNVRFSATPPRYWLDFMRPASSYSRAEWRELVAAYDNSLYYLDDQLSRLFENLEARGLLDETLVIVTSDHGEEFGEHGFTQHGKSLYWPALHVPLLISLPGRIPPARRVSVPVSLRDIPATVMDAIVDSAGGFPGGSLLPVIRHGAPDPSLSVPISQVNPGINWPADWRAARGTMHSVVMEGLRLIRHAEGEELYDLAADPWEERDLAKEYATARVRLETLLDSAISGRNQAGVSIGRDDRARSRRRSSDDPSG